MEYSDPIEELEQVRQKILTKAGGTPAGLMRYLRALEKKQASKCVKQKTKAAADKTAKRRKALTT